MDKDVRQLVKAAARQGFEAVPHGAHVRVTNKRTGEWTTLAKTPSDYRWRKNAIANLRRMGFNPHR
ncbi:hypothetical protein [Nocardioides nanhaiensis]|uniref:Type II toxin-antitoxin system HicA family toxin n=1 Tax=Nocardioides nanhaiensis TaxID=1476871 RepID=A0ABP8W3R7_9ACTN